MKKKESIALTLPATMAGTGWLQALRGSVVLMALCGFLYPLVSVTTGTTLFPHQATGSVIEREGKVIGSTLVGQPFSAPGYFQSRPSAAGYDPFNVAGSNWAPSNPDLRKRAEATSKAISKEDGVAPDRIPVDLIAASGSGIDPHISPAAAEIQTDRVATTRGLPRDDVADLVAQYMEHPVLGVLGQPRVNVLQLNLALDKLDAQSNAR